MASLQEMTSGGIHIKPSHEGRLRAKTHTPAGKKIPVAVLEAKKHSSDPKTRKQATFAINARKWGTK